MAAYVKEGDTRYQRIDNLSKNDASAMMQAEIDRLGQLGWTVYLRGANYANLTDGLYNVICLTVYC